MLSLDTCQCPRLSLSFCPEGKLCFPCLGKCHLYPLLRRTGGYSQCSVGFVLGGMRSVTEDLQMF